MKRRKARRIVYLIGIIACIYVIYIAYSICSYGEMVEQIQGDVAIVLGAATWKEEPSPVFRERINHGIWLYNHGYVQDLLFTGGRGEGKSLSESRIAMNYAIKAGVPVEDIYIEELSTITQENIQQAAIIMEEQGMKRAILVSDPLHMKRAMLMAKDYGIEAYSSPTPTTRYISLGSKARFLTREVFYYIGYQVYRLFSY